MAARHCTGGSPPASAQSARIWPAVQRGQLFHVVVDVAFPVLHRAVCAWSAIHAEVDRPRRRAGGAA